MRISLADLNQTNFNLTGNIHLLAQLLRTTDTIEELNLGSIYITDRGKPRGKR
jgi:hypothetical protein